jgi:hypothetical protein
MNINQFEINAVSTTVESASAASTYIERFNQLAKKTRVEAEGTLTQAQIDAKIKYNLPW